MVRDRLPGDASAGLLDWLRGTASDDATERSDRAADGQVAERADAESPERAADEQSPEIGDARPDVVDATVSARSRPSSSSRRAAADSGEGREWTEDDPIQFGVDDGADDQSLLDAVTPESDDASLSGETAVLAGGLGVETRDTASEESPDAERGASEVASRDAPAVDASGDRSAAQAGDSRRAGRTTRGNGDDSQLPNRVASVADEQESVTTNVEALESEVEGLHGELESVRSDLETLVTLVKQTAPTRGGVAATDPSGAAAEQSGAVAEQSEVENEQSPATGTPRAGEETSSPAESGATDRTPAGDASAPGDSPDPARDEPERTSDGAASPSSTVDDSGDEREDETAREGDRASSAEDAVSESAAERRSPGRSPIDPRSDEVEARLRTYRERFERAPGEGEHVSLERLGRGVDDDDRTGGDGDDTPGANDDGASGADGSTSGANGGAGTDDEDDAVEHDFEFAKVLVPPGGDGTPDAVGDDMEQPYLEALPEGVAAEAAVIEWLDGIVSTADQAGAVQAVEFYESIDWITADVRDELLGYLKGVGPVDETASATRPPEELELADHRRSLEYVTGLATGEVTADGI